MHWDLPDTCQTGGIQIIVFAQYLSIILRWNQLDVAIVFLSIVGIALEEIEGQVFPINPTIIRVMRVLRIARVLKLLKMAKGIRALLDTVMQALPQVQTTFFKSLIIFPRWETLASSSSSSSSYLPPLVWRCLGV